jgi:hypothetical protein
MMIQEAAASEALWIRWARLTGVRVCAACRQCVRLHVT